MAEERYERRLPRQTRNILAVQPQPSPMVGGGGGGGGQFERQIGVVKHSLYKFIGNGNFRLHELEEVISDVERIINDRQGGRRPNAETDP